MVSVFHRNRAFAAGKKAALEGKTEAACNREPGTIYYDDWHDGFDEGRRESQS